MQRIDATIFNPSLLFERGTNQNRFHMETHGNAYACLVFPQLYAFING